MSSLQEKNIPYPVMIKASEGGGGKGIRKIRCEAEFEVNFRRVQVGFFVSFCMEICRVRYVHSLSLLVCDTAKKLLNRITKRFALCFLIHRYATEIHRSVSRNCLLL